MAKYKEAKSDNNQNKRNKEAKKLSKLSRWLENVLAWEQVKTTIANYSSRGPKKHINIRTVQTLVSGMPTCMCVTTSM